MPNAIFKAAPYNPPHLFVSQAVYMLTGSIYQRTPLMELHQRKAEWRDAFHEAARLSQWGVIAWVVLNNHYHAIAQSPEHGVNLSKFINSYHKFTARRWNIEDGLQGRQVWWNYWDTCIRSEEDYYSRLTYVVWNPVKHGLINKPEEYPFSNYKEFSSEVQELDCIEGDKVKDVPEF
jgi:putative transposase